MKNFEERIWRVLVAEDVEEYSNFISARLGILKIDYGIITQVVQTKSAKEAKKVLKKELSEKRNFDLFLLDVKMETDTAGFELVKFIKQDLNIASPVMIITGEAGISEKLARKNYIITSFIRKINFDKEFEKEVIFRLKGWDSELKKTYRNNSYFDNLCWFK
jgi:c-di-GMP phosphodiesterase